MIIAIDGPAAAGKSTVARALARRLGLSFLDTGAMYRAVTLAVLERGVDLTDGAGCARVAASLDLAFDEHGAIQVDGRPGEPSIREPRVSRAVSEVSAHPSVRERIVPLQRALATASPRGVVAEGRDTTTVVFPDADHKFFLTAGSAVRAERRARELGEPERLAEIRGAIERRDRYDAERADSPLREAPDAVRIDTDLLSPDAIVERMIELVQASRAH